MAGKSRKRSKQSRGVRARITSLAQGILTTIILVGAGVLIGSFWGEWRVVRLNDAPALDPPARALSDRVQVEIRNGTGEAGLAGEFSSWLRDLGFDVVSVGNADHFDHATTFVVDRSGRPGAALELAQEVGTDSIEVALDPDLFLDATLVMGRDWKTVFASH